MARKIVTTVKGGKGMTISLKQVTVIAASVVSIAAAWTVGGNVFNYFGKTSDIIRVEAKALSEVERVETKTMAEVSRVEVKGETTALELRQLQNANSLDRYRTLCGADFKKCPTERDQVRVEELLKEQKKLDEEQRELLQEQRQILREQRQAPSREMKK